MCYRIHFKHKKCGHQSSVNMYCPLAPRHALTQKPLGKFCQKSKASGKVYKKHTKARMNWKCPLDQCKDYERLKRYWRCCGCGKGPNKEPFCGQTVPRQSFEICRSERGEGKRKRGRSWSPVREVEGRDARGKVEGGMSPPYSYGEEEKEDDKEVRGSRRRSISIYRRTCGHQPCPSCTWFGATIPTYSQKSGQWERNGSSSESDTFFRSLNQPEPDTDEEPTESPDDCMTDTEFDPELYIEEDDEDMDDAGDDKDEEDQFYDAVEHMGVVESVEPQDDVGNIYDADTEAEDDDQQQEDSSSEEDMEVDSDDSDNSDDSDDSDESDGDDPGLEALYKDPDEMTDAKWIASVRGAQRGANGMSFIEGSDHDIEAMTDAEFNASVRRAQRGRNGMSFTESPEHLDDESEDDDSGEEEGEEEDDEDEDRGGDEENESEDSEATISNPDMNFHSGEEGSDGERAGSSDQDGDENNPREPQPAKLQQSSTTDGGTEPSQVMEEGGPVISLGPPHASPDGVLPPTRER